MVGMLDKTRYAYKKQSRRSGVDLSYKSETKLNAPQPENNIYKC